MNLVTTIASIAENLRTNKYQNETAIREAVVNRVLQELGWDIFNPEAVRREYGTLERRRVDYSLFTMPNSPSVFIEVKAPNAGANGDRQLFQYAFDAGAPFAILVDGREWSFFLPGEQGAVLERRVHKLDLLEREPIDAADVLQRYLAYERIKSGKAFEAAREDYRNAARDREAKNAIPKAWNELITEPDDLLIDLIAEKVVSLIGFRPTDEHVEEFLTRLKSDICPSPPLSINHVRQAPTKQIELSNPTPSRPGRQVAVVFFGTKSEHQDGISALIFILKELEKRRPGFLLEFAKIAPGRRRNHISKIRADVYPNKPELEVYTTNELGGGWWLGTNIANREKQRLIQIACDVFGVKFGREIQIDLPNTQE
jgi:predicted type IV restriction endonuclease